MAKRSSSFPLPSSVASMRTEAAGQWENDEISRRSNIICDNHNDDDSFMEATMQQRNGNGKMMLHDDMLRYLINSDNKTSNLKVMDYSHLVPDHDEDHDHYDLQYQHQNHHYYSTLLLDDATAPTATEFDHIQQMKHNFFDDADDAAVKMINSKISYNFGAKCIIPQPCNENETIPITVPAVAADDDDDDKHSVVPHHHQYDLPLNSHHCSFSQFPASKQSQSSDPKSKLADNENSDKKEAEAEAIVPSLSVCSNDLPYPTSNAQNQSIEHEEHYQRVLTRKKSGSWQTTPPKTKLARTRANRLHNFSQRKRRDNKIKKKMRQLQQLIPNCDNKVDKAAILDEAIVYLKALQIQLQIMLMGTGVMPPMMIGNGTLAPHLNYMPTTSALSPFQMLGFHPHAHAASFVPLMTPSLILPHPSISLSTSMNSNPSHQLH